jgi:hypothetical protein
MGTYIVATDFLDAEKQKAEFQFLKNEIEEKGFFLVERQIKYDGLSKKLYGLGSAFFTPEMAYFILIMKNIKAKDSITQAEVTINGLDFFNDYESGHNRAIEFFNKTFGVSNEVLYGENSKVYVSTLHAHCYHTKINNIYDGWLGFVKGSFPYTISGKVIYDYGFYAGLISKVEGLKWLHPSLFENFDKCK